jgi:hypothetical protein
MKTLGDLRTEFFVRSQSSSTLAFYTDEITGDWADQAHKWAAGYKKWPFTEGRVSTTFASLSTSEDGYLVGEYPEGWKSDSLRLLTVGGKRFNKKNFYKFQSFIEDNPSADDKLFTDFGRRFYINPNASGLSGTVVVWGQYTPATIDNTDPSVTTVFSGEEDGNDAIVEKMIALAKTREKKLNEAIAHEKKASLILDELWKKIQDEQFGYQDTDNEGMFKRIDIVGGGFRDDTYNRDQF